MHGLRERPIWWAVWDLGLIVTCPAHGCHLLNQCPDCTRRIAWERPAVHKCRCGLDFRHVSSELADPGLVAINAIVFRAAKSTLADTAGEEVADFGFPQEMLHLKLGPLLRFILFMGSINDGSILRRKQRPFRATDLAGVVAICRGAVSLLRDWPRPLREVLRRMIRNQRILPRSTSATSLGISIGTCFAFFLAGNLNSFTTPSRSSLSKIGRASSAASTVTFPLPYGGIPSG
jgi:hypothetical protein